MEKSKLMMTVIIVLLVGLLGTIVGAAFFIVTSLNKHSPQEGSSNQTIYSTVESLSPSQIDTFQLSDSITTNLARSRDGEVHGIKILVGIGVNNTVKKESPKFMGELSEKEVIVRDAIITIIRGKTYEEAIASDFKELISNEILQKLQEMFRSNLLVKVYIPDIYVQ